MSNFNDNVAKRYKVGTVWHTVFIISTIIAVIMLIVLLLNIINGALQVCSSIFEPYSTMFDTTELRREIKFVLEKLQEPLLKVFEVREGRKVDVETCTAWFEKGQ